MSTENCENYAIINGKKYLISDDEAEKCLSFLKSVSPFEIVNGEIYYYIQPDGTISSAQYVEDATDESLSAVANCCRSIELMRQRAYWETLNRLLWRYSKETRKREMRWGMKYPDRYIIFYDADDGFWKVDTSSSWNKFIGYPYFESREIACNAIEDIVLPFIEIHPDFDPLAD